jgi:uridylate kinase
VIVVQVLRVKITIKLGGFSFPPELDVEKIKPYANVISRLRREGNELVIVTGGGKNARKYIGAARKLGASEAICDQIGILVARLNARLLIISLDDDAYPDVPENLEEVRHFFQLGKVVVMGGLQPGHSTNAVAALVAETIGSSLLINVTDVDGVYTADPKRNPMAKKIDEVSTDKLLSLASSEHIVAGSYELMDPLSVRIIDRSHIPTWIVSGEDPENIVRILRGEHVGTKITSHSEK